MKKFLHVIIAFLQAASTARAATALTRMGRWREAQALMNK
jgi:hypothetical protein